MGAFRIRSGTAVFSETDARGRFLASAPVPPLSLTSHARMPMRRSHTSQRLRVIACAAPPRHTTAARSTDCRRLHRHMMTPHMVAHYAGYWHGCLSLASCAARRALPVTPRLSSLSRTAVSVSLRSRVCRCPSEPLSSRRAAPLPHRSHSRDVASGARAARRRFHLVHRREGPRLAQRGPERHVAADELLSHRRGQTTDHVSAARQGGSGPVRCMRWRTWYAKESAQKVANHVPK